MSLDARLTIIFEGYSQTDVGLYTSLLNRYFRITEEEVARILQLRPTILESDFWATYDKLNTIDKGIIDNLVIPDKKPTFQDALELVRSLAKRIPNIRAYFIRSPNRLHDLASFIYRNWDNLLLIQDIPEDAPGREDIEETPGIETIQDVSHGQP